MVTLFTRPISFKKKCLRSCVKPGETKKLGIEGKYEGIGNLILGYAAAPAGDPAPRKADYIFKI